MLRITMIVMYIVGLVFFVAALDGAVKKTITYIKEKEWIKAVVGIVVFLSMMVAFTGSYLYFRGI